MPPKKGTPEYEEWRNSDGYEEYCKWTRNTAPMIAANIGRKRSDLSDRNKTEDMRTKVSASKTGSKNPMFGVPPWNKGKKCPEISERQRGENNPSYGKGDRQRGEKNPIWNGGTSFLPYCFKFDKRRRESVRKFFNNFCIICGKHQSENVIRSGQISLSVHHVDHDKEQGCNGKPFNLVPLCHECHNKEIHYEEEYKKYINKTLEEGFNRGIWSRDQYEKEAMY